jgi:hypothetical protein
MILTRLPLRKAVPAEKAALAISAIQADGLALGADSRAALLACRNAGFYRLKQGT